MMKFPPFLTKEALLVGILIATILCISLSPDNTKWKATPVGHVYQPIHNSLIDYPVYISFIKQGLEGQSVLFDRFTTELHEGSIIVPFYLVLGWIGRVTRITNPDLLYHASRITLGILWGCAVYWFIRLCVKGTCSRLTALFLILYSSSFPFILRSQSGFSIGWSMTWWSELSPIEAFTFLPHHLFGHILLLVTIASVASRAFPGFLKTSLFRKYRLSLGMGTGVVAGLVHPPSLLLPIFLLPLWAFMTRQFRICLQYILIVAVWLAVLYGLYAQTFRFPWTTLEQYERLMFAISLPEYLLALGPIVPLGLLGLYCARKKPYATLFFLWIAIPLICLILMPSVLQSPLRTLAISNIRFLQMAIRVPLGILSVEALIWIKNRYGTALGLFLLIVMVIMTFIGYPWALQTQEQHLFGGPLYQYPTAGWMRAVQSLEAGDKTKAVLSLPFAGLTIGSQTNRTVFVGREVYTLNMNQKTDAAWRFLNGSMPVCEAFSLLNKNRISDVFYGYDEKQSGGDPSAYPFLRLKQDFGDTQIYEFTGEKPTACK